VAGNERDCGVRALDALVHVRDGVEQFVGREVGARNLLLQRVREHVEQDLGVARRVEVPAVDVEELIGELAGVREVAVVHEHQAVWRVHVERLHLVFALRRA